MPTSRIAAALVAALLALPAYAQVEVLMNSAVAVGTNNVGDTSAQGACSYELTAGTCSADSWNNGNACRFGGDADCSSNGLCDVSGQGCRLAVGLPDCTGADTACIDISPGTVGTCVGGGDFVLGTCRDRDGNTCLERELCDLQKVPAGRCSKGQNLNCLWPRGAGYCSADANQGCLGEDLNGTPGVDDLCERLGAPPANPNDPDNDGCVLQDRFTQQDINPADCACQGDDPNSPGFETDICGAPGAGVQDRTGICSDGDPLTSTDTVPGGIPGQLTTALCTDIGLPSASISNCGEEGGLNLRSPQWGEETPAGPVAVPQRRPGNGSEVAGGAARNLVNTRGGVYQWTDPDPARGNIRTYSLRADSAFPIFNWVNKELTGGAVNASTITWYCDAPVGFQQNLPVSGTCFNDGSIACVENSDCVSVGGNCDRTQYCWEVPINSSGILWTEDIDPADASIRAPALDIDGNGLDDCPPICNFDYSYTSLEIKTIEAVGDLDTEAGIQLAFDSMTSRDGATPKAGDTLAVAPIVSYTWTPNFDHRCHVGGYPAAVFADPFAIGRCSLSAVGCDPRGTCTGDLTTRCRADSECAGPGGTCDFNDQGTECPGGESCVTCGGPLGTQVPNFGANVPVTAPNTLALPIAYNTHGFARLQTHTDCTGAASPSECIPGAITHMAGSGAALKVPLFIILTGGVSGGTAVDMDTRQFSFQLDRSDLGLSAVLAGGAAGAEPGGGRYGLGSGGSFTDGTIFPAGGSCCDKTGNVTGNQTSQSSGIPQVTANATQITWRSSTADTEVYAVAPMRLSGWYPGPNRVPGCPGDNSGAEAFEDQPEGVGDLLPCNDALGVERLPGPPPNDSSDVNTGSDDIRMVYDFDGNAATPAEPAILPRGRSTNLLGGTAADLVNAAPTIYYIGVGSGIDIDLSGDNDTDFIFKNELTACPQDPATPRGEAGGLQCGDFWSAFTNVCGDQKTEAPFEECDGTDDAACPGECEILTCTCPAGGPDLDGDGVLDPDDNCLTIPNPGQEDVGEVNAGGTADGVGDACDICSTINNPVEGAPQPFWTLVNGQRDGNASGAGTRCDGKIIAGAAVGGGDTTEFRASFLVPIENPGVPGTVNNACGTTGTRNCDQFDMDGAGAAIGGGDTTAVRGRFLLVPGPTGTTAAPVGAAGAGDVAGVLTCVGPCCPTTQGDLLTRPASCQP